jgi:trimeric autotransporter adhesin
MKKTLLSLYDLIFIYGCRLQCLLSLAIIIAASSFSNAQIRLVADMNTGTPGDETAPSRRFSNHVSIGTRSFFISAQYYGQELWTSDGTEEGTVMLMFSRDISALQVSGGFAFFTALTDQHGAELWKSDGTVGGTILLKDIYPGGGSSSPSSLTDVNGTLFFSANDNTHGRELWKSDGTPDGTQLVKDVKAGTGSSGVSRITAFGSLALLVANDGNIGYELWKSDGTAAGTSAVADIHPAGNSSPSDITVAGGIAFFAAETPSTNRQLYKTDGTVAGTSLVKIIRPGYNARIAKITAVNDVVFFEAFDAAHGTELWKSDGTAAGTQLVKDITPGPASATREGGVHINHFESVNGKLFFIAVADYFYELWVSDGTTEGTFAIEVIDYYSLGKFDAGFAKINGEAYFVAMEFWSSDLSLFKTDGLSATIVKPDLAFCACEIVTGPTPDPPAPHFVAVNDEHYFFAGSQYWKTNGTAEGTVLIRDLTFGAGTRAEQLTDLNGTLLFRLEEFGAGPYGLWKTNGTPESTSMIAGIWAEGLRRVNELAYFGASSGDEPRPTPHRTDGTAEGTIALNTGLIWPSRFTASRGLAFFHAQGPNGSELYKSDGTPAGTVLVKDINPGADHGHPLDLTDVANTLFFSAETVEHGRELWKSDGTEAGTTLVKDIAPGSASSDIRYALNYQGQLYFQANDQVNGLEFWRSNGTAEGTVRITSLGAEVKDAGPLRPTNGFLLFFTLNESGNVSLWRTSSTVATKLRDFEVPYLPLISTISSPGNHLLFLVNTGADTELWRTNGTPTGTVRLRKFRSVGYLPVTSALRGNISYFGFAGTVWRSDGSAEGTYSLPFYGDAKYFTTSGPYVYFHATSFEHGSELFLIEEETTSSTSITGAIEPFGTKDGITGFPNPFRSTFTLRVDAPGQDEFTLSVLDSKGQEVETKASLPCNVEHTLGSSWNEGMYFLRIRKGAVISVQKAIKTLD